MDQMVLEVIQTVYFSIIIVDVTTVIILIIISILIVALADRIAVT